MKILLARGILSRQKEAEEHTVRRRSKENSEPKFSLLSCQNLGYSYNPRQIRGKLKAERLVASFVLENLERNWKADVFVTTRDDIPVWIGWLVVIGRECPGNPKLPHFLVSYVSSTFSIIVIQVYAPTTNAEEAEVGWFCEDLKFHLELTPKISVLFIIGDWNAKGGSQKVPGGTGRFGLVEQNEVGQRLTEFCQESSLIVIYILFQKQKR